MERLWWGGKYEEVYKRAYESMGDARMHLKAYLDDYNMERPHRVLDGRTFDDFYCHAFLGGQSPQLSAGSFSMII